jgi:4-amino-4-deoxy-L-arabinose transferase-like glycosyltransferase
VNTPSQPRSARELAENAVAALLVGISLFGNLGALGLVGPDEPRYVWIARAMAETGDWVTPRLYGLPWFEKPILYYWSAALGFKLDLSAEWAARLPSAFAALAATIAIGWLGGKFFTGSGRPRREGGGISAVVFATSVAAIGFARAATPDMLFSASLTLAMASAASVLNRAGVLPIPGAAFEETRVGSDVPGLALFGLFLGLGVLAKGPAAVILAGGAIAVWAAFTGNIRSSFRLAHPVALSAFLVVAFPWYALCAARNPNFLHIFIFEHNFERYLTPVFQHSQRFWFFLPVALVAVIPWTAFLAAAFAEAIRTWKANTLRISPAFFFACWAIFPILFFSFSKSKLPSYILPGIPALTLVATAAAQRVVRQSRFGAVAIASLVAITWAALAAVALYQIRRLPPYITANYDLPWIKVCATIAVALFGAALLLAGAKQKFLILIALNAVAVAASVEFANARLLPSIDPFVSARIHGLYAEHNSTQQFFMYRLSRSWKYGLAFYAHREIPEWTPANPTAGIVLTNPAGYAELRGAHRFRDDFRALDQGLLYVPVSGADLGRSSQVP